MIVKIEISSGYDFARWYMFMCPRTQYDSYMLDDIYENETVFDKNSIYNLDEIIDTLENNYFEYHNDSRKTVVNLEDFVFDYKGQLPEDFDITKFTSGNIKYISEICNEIDGVCFVDGLGNILVYRD